LLQAGCPEVICTVCIGPVPGHRCWSRCSCRRTVLLILPSVLLWRCLMVTHSQGRVPTVLKQ
jgi:hypothetical protein